MNPDSTGHFAGQPDKWPQAQSGEQYVDIGNIPSTAISQTFQLPAAGTFLFAWYDNTALDTGLVGSPYSVNLFDGASHLIFSDLFDAFNPDGAWSANSFSKALAAGNYTLEFKSTNRPLTLDTLVDNVSVSVPEPGSLAAVALAILCISHRRSKIIVACQ